MLEGSLALSNRESKPLEVSLPGEHELESEVSPVKTATVVRALKGQCGSSDLGERSKGSSSSPQNAGAWNRPQGAGKTLERL